MKKLTKKDISPEVFDLYDDYAHNKIDRRGFIEKLGMYAVAGITVPSLLSWAVLSIDKNLLLPVVALSSWPLRLIILRVWVNFPWLNLLVTALTWNSPLKPGTICGNSIVAPVTNAPTVNNNQTVSMADMGARNPESSYRESQHAQYGLGSNG